MRFIIFFGKTFPQTFLPTRVHLLYSEAALFILKALKDILRYFGSFLPRSLQHYEWMNIEFSFREKETCSSKKIKVRKFPKANIVVF